MSDSPHSATNSAAWNRRRLFHAGGLAALGSLAITSLSSPTLANDELEESPATPQEALARLIEGNQRFASGQPLSIHQDLNRVKAIAARQTPSNRATKVTSLAMSPRQWLAFLHTSSKIS